MKDLHIIVGMLVSAQGQECGDSKVHGLVSQNISGHQVTSLTTQYNTENICWKNQSKSVAQAAPIPTDVLLRAKINKVYPNFSKTLLHLSVCRNPESIYIHYTCLMSL